MLEQQLDHLGVAIVGGAHQRGPVTVVAGVDIGPGLDQDQGSFQMALEGCPA